MDTSDENSVKPEENAELTGELEAGTRPDLEKLRIYARTKLALAEQLRIVRESLTALGRQNGERQCGELVVKLAEDRFTLAVLGQFKRGKSSLMNAIIGRELLPTGVLPLTSAITVLKYGPVERLVVRREGWSMSEEMPVSALADYVTEKGNPGNRKNVRSACIELPVQFLRRGIEFVDTPGVGSAITANTATTYSFLPECDAVLFVTSVDTPMTSMELEFLKQIRQYVENVFFVVNKIDLVAEAERNEVLNFVTETIRGQTGSSTVKVFPLSARDGLTARISGDGILYERSGLKLLEETLASFLSEEKSSVFLSALTRKALRILDEEAAQNAFGEATLQARSRAMQKEGYVSLRRDPRAAAAAVMDARARLQSLLAAIVGNRMAEIAEAPISVPTAKEPSPTAVSTTIEQSGDIAADLMTRECPVCLYIAQQASDFFADWQYQISTDRTAQNLFARELGFCPLHTWQLLAMSSPHGASVGFAGMVEEIARRLRKKSTGPAVTEELRLLVRDSRNCRVCEYLKSSEEEYIERLSSLIEDAAGRRQYGRSQGVCLRHLKMLAETVSADSVRGFIISHAAQRFDEDAEDMRSYAMKHEALRRALHNRNEEDAYWRAIVHIAGSQSVCAPWAMDGEI